MQKLLFISFLGFFTLSAFASINNYHYGEERIEQYLGISTRSHERIDLERYFNLERRHYGSELKRIVFHVNSNSYYSRARLELRVNGRIVGRPKTITNSTRVAAFTLERLHGGNIIGRNIRSITLVTSGEMFIGEVMAVVEDHGHNPYPPSNSYVLENYVNRHFRDREQVSLNSLLGYQQNIPNLKVEKIEIMASAPYSSARMKICSGYNCSFEQSLNRYQSKVTFHRVPSHFSARDLQFIFNGNVEISHIKVFFERNYSRYPY